MRIGVTSQNFRTITGHAGKTRRFLIYEGDTPESLQEVERLDLPREMAMHEYRGTMHPLYDLDVLVTGGCGPGFVRRMAEQGVRVVATSETDPLSAARAVLRGEPLSPPVAHGH